MAGSLEIGAAALAALEREPSQRIDGRLNGSRYDARIAIPHYGDNVARHYAELLPTGLSEVCSHTSIAAPFRHFGLICEFAKPVELNIHDAELNLQPGIRELIGRYGPIVLKNAYLPADSRRADQRNIFPNLSFHFDRGANQPTQYSLFYRDPFDPEQAAPRRSSTLHAANIVLLLQSAREQHRAPEAVPWSGRYNVFGETELRDVIDNVLLEHRWDAPQGTGEISVLFNGAILHASYYRHKDEQGYPISVRYLR